MSPRTPTSLQLYLRLLSYTRPYWRVFALSIVGLVITAATEPAMPALLQPILDRSFVDKDLSFMRWVPFMLVGLFVVRGLASFMSDYCAQWVAQKVIADLRNRMFATLLRLPPGYYDANTTGALISKFTYDTMQVTAAATSAITVLVKDSLVIVGLLAFLLWTNWQLTLISFVVAPVIVFIVGRFAARMRRMSRAEQGAMGNLNHVLEEAIAGQRVVKVFDGLEYETKRFLGAADRVRRFNMKSVVAASANAPLTQIAASLAVAVILWLALEQAANDRTTVGGFVAFLGALLMLLSPIKRLTNVSQSLQKGLAAAESVFALMDEQREVDQGSRTIERARGRIELAGVHLRYAGAETDALRGIDLVIEAGETVALVGASGSGKSTLASLIPRFYAADRGTITIDGIPIDALALASLRANIALVSQDVVLFNDTVAANIAYGRLERASREDIVAAARAANALSFIETMPQGLDTVIGENGVRLSGGQRQRLAIARAFLKNAPILILDEATSALDSESERNVQSALDELMVGRTTIVIAHRLSTIEKADRIVVMHEGRIVEIGSHRELLARDGAYARLHHLQYAGADPAPVAAPDSARP